MTLQGTLQQQQLQLQQLPPRPTASMTSTGTSTAPNPLVIPTDPDLTRRDTASTVVVHHDRGGTAGRRPGWEDDEDEGVGAGVPLDEEQGRREGGERRECMGDGCCCEGSVCV